MVHPHSYVSPEAFKDLLVASVQMHIYDVNWDSISKYIKSVDIKLSLQRGR